MNLDELYKILKTSENVDEIDKYRNDIRDLMPSIEVMFDFDQKNSYHQYDLWFHSLHTVINLPRGLDDNMLYLAALLHDIGKPESQCKGKRDDDLNMHYYGHQERSVFYVDTKILPELAYNGYNLDHSEFKRLNYYIRYHDDHVSLRLKHVKRHIELVNLEVFRLLMLLQIADANAHIIKPIIQERIDICTELYESRAYENYKRILKGE